MISMYEVGKTLPRDTTIQNLADALGVDYAWLRGDKNDTFEFLPDDLRDRLAKSAETNGTSVFEEIVTRLEQSFFASSEAGELMRIADSFSKEGAIIKGVTDHVRASLSEISKVLDEMDEKAHAYKKIAADHEVLAGNKAATRKKTN